MNSSLTNIITLGDSSSFKNIFKAVRILFSILLLIWCVGFLFPILTPSFKGKSFIEYMVAHVYSLVCHQSGSSNITFGDSHLLVCVRCAGIYTGAFITDIILLFSMLKIKLDLKLFIISSSLLLIDVIAVRIGLYPYSKTIAGITGLLCGAIIIIYIVDAVENSFHPLKSYYHDT